MGSRLTKSINDTKPCGKHGDERCHLRVADTLDSGPDQKYSDTLMRAPGGESTRHTHNPPIPDTGVQLFHTTHSTPHTVTIVPNILDT